MVFRAWRYLWPLPWTALGLAAAVLAGLLGARWRWRQGALEVHGGQVARLCAAGSARCRFDAITLGHVILGLQADGLDALRAHEQVHVRQYERWGPLFVPAYLACSAWQWACGGDPYRANRFEREAYRLASLCYAPPTAVGGTTVE